MSEEPRDPALLIGLHKLAEQNGDGLVPELHALLCARAEAGPFPPNVVALPPRKASLRAAPIPGRVAKLLTFGR